MSTTPDVISEPLTMEENLRFTIKPLAKEYEIFWKLYKKQQDCYWRAEEINFSKDSQDYDTLTPDEQYFIKMVLAFFAASDGIVNFNLRTRFLKEFAITEVQVCYGWQLMMENIHGEIYSDMLINIIKDSAERTHLFNAIKEIPAVKTMADWAFKWIQSDASIGQRIIAFAIVEGIFFSGAFAAIFWLKKQRGNGGLFMEGLIKSNRFISRDEGLHCCFACVLYSCIKTRVPVETVVDMFRDAVAISQKFMTDSIKCQMIGMSAEHMNQYIEYVADRMLVYLNYEKIYNGGNPFDFMETIGLLSKDNFFETRPDGYQTAHNEDNRADWKFTIEEDF